jgi:hypothetical protein
MEEWQAFLDGLGYRYWDESSNPAYQLFLGWAELLEAINFFESDSQYFQALEQGARKILFWAFGLIFLSITCKIGAIILKIRIPNYTICFLNLS